MKKIGLAGAGNVRDFAETAVGRNQHVRRGICLRSDALDALTEEDVKLLKETYRLAAVIDLRTEEEQKERPDRMIPGSVRYSVPLLSGSAMGITHEKGMDYREVFQAVPDMRELYRRIVTDKESVAQLKRVFGIILKHAEEGEGAILWHCTEGKDRCGIVSALFLMLLGADEKTVFEDYMMTNDSALGRAEAICARIEEETGDAALASGVRRLFVAKEEYLAAALEAVRETWGGAGRFFEDALGISKESQQKLIGKAVETI